MLWQTRTSLVVVLLVSSGYFINANTDTALDHQGRHFIFAFTKNRFTEYFPKMKVFVTSDNAEPVTVSLNNPLISFGRISQTKVIQPNNYARFNIDVAPYTKIAELSDSSVENKGFELIASAKVTVQIAEMNQKSSDAYIAFPTEVLGKRHFIMSYIYKKQSKFTQGPSQMALVGTVDGTSVTLTLPNTDSILRPPLRVEQDGTTLYLTLDKYRTLQLQGDVDRTLGSKDLTGTRVETDQPVAVFAGAVWTSVDTELQGDHLVEQIPSADTWGVQFYTVPIASRSSGDVYRILCQYDNTAVYIYDAFTKQRQSKVSLKAGQWHDEYLGSNVFSYIVASRPILLAQLTKSHKSDNVINSDPFLTLITPVYQYTNKYVFSTIQHDNVGNQGIPDFWHYINLVLNSAKVNDLTLDGNAIPTEAMVVNWVKLMDNENIFAAIVNLSHIYASPKGFHILRHSSPFGGIIYGFGHQESYAHSLGQTFKDTTGLCVSVEMEWADNFDNDCDGWFDEEAGNGVDDDGDGLIDEDVYDAHSGRPGWRDDYIETFTMTPHPEEDEITTQTTKDKTTTAVKTDGTTQGSTPEGSTSVMSTKGSTAGSTAESTAASTESITSLDTTAGTTENVQTTDRASTLITTTLPEATTTNIGSTGRESTVTKAKTTVAPSTLHTETPSTDGKITTLGGTTLPTTDGSISSTKGEPTLGGSTIGSVVATTGGDDGDSNSLTTITTSAAGEETTSQRPSSVSTRGEDTTTIEQSTTPVTTRRTSQHGESTSHLEQLSSTDGNAQHSTNDQNGGKTTSIGEMSTEKSTVNNIMEVPNTTTESVVDMISKLTTTVDDSLAESTTQDQASVSTSTDALSSTLEWLVNGTLSTINATASTVTSADDGGGHGDGGGITQQTNSHPVTNEPYNLLKDKPFIVIIPLSIIIGLPLGYCMYAAVKAFVSSRMAKRQSKVAPKRPKTPPQKRPPTPRYKKAVASFDATTDASAANKS